MFSDENRVKLLAKGENVVASDFGNEGTGGHSHLIYAWKTGQPQKFVVTAKAESDHTDYTGYWFHPEQKTWKLIASFRAPHDGKLLRSLYSFNENFGGSNGHLQRKALFGPQWIRLADGKWQEITESSFSHDGTGKENRIDRYMGVEKGLFFLSNGGFVPGYTKSGDKFTRPATGHAPEIQLPAPPAKLKPWLPTYKDHLVQQLTDIRAAGLYKSERIITTPQDAHIRVIQSTGSPAIEREVLNLCANNYLGLAEHPEVIAAAHAGLDRWVTGFPRCASSAARSNCTSNWKRSSASFLGTDDTILYSSCFDANGGFVRDAARSGGRHHFR